VDPPRILPGMRAGWLVPLFLLGTACHSEDDHTHDTPSTTTKYPQPATPSDVKVYVALESGNAIMVLDGRDLAPLAKVSLGEYSPHNVQVAPDGKTVWATLVSAHGHGGGEPGPDRVVVLDAANDAILSTIELGPDVHPAHVVLTPDSKTAFVTGNSTNEVIRIDVASRALTRIGLEHGTGPHGARVDSNGNAWVAQIEGKCVARIGAGTQQHVETNGQAVQTAVTPKWIFASLYDTRSVARIDPTSLDVTYATLPAESQGPVQLYPTDNGNKLLVADQGLLAGRPASNKLYVLDTDSLALLDTIEVGLGAHGVVADGDRAYVTSLSDDAVTMVDLTTKRVVARATVGGDPNGISLWTRRGGAP